MLLETGTLPVGVRDAGGRHQAFELRPPTVEDNIEATLQVAEMPEGAASGLKLSVAVLARQIVTLGTLQREQITLELVTRLHPKDLDALMAAEVRLEKKALDDGLPLDGGSPSEPGAPATASPSGT